MGQLRADFHTHTSDDPCDELAYSTEMLIDAAAQLNLQALALTCHQAFRFSERLAEYARRRGITLVPGIEHFIEGKHVLILNPDDAHLASSTFEDLRAAGRRGAAFIAPHPFYPTPTSLRGALIANIDLFDAIEYCTLYFRGLDFNRKAVAVARRHGLPLVGTSDTHALPYCDSTHSLVNAEPTVEGIVSAIRAGRVEPRTRPRPLAAGIKMICFALGNTVMHITGHA